MGDRLHKKPPISADEEDVTDAFRRDALAMLKANADKNRLSGLSKGDPGYLIANRADLAKAVGTDSRMMSKILGPERATTQVTLVKRSVLVRAIREALGLEEVTEIMVRTSRAAVARMLADLSEEAFKVAEAAIRRGK